MIYYTVHIAQWVISSRDTDGGRTTFFINKSNNNNSLLIVVLDVFLYAVFCISLFVYKPLCFVYCQAQLSHSCQLQPKWLSFSLILHFIHPLPPQNWVLMWHLTRRGLCHCLMPDYARRSRTSTLIMVPIKFWRNSDPFKKKRTFF